jgi:adenylate cyclase
MEFRIGVNLGDVIEEGERIYGDGVNIAARLEALADPGGICVSKTALDHIESKLPLGYEYLGEQEVKNMPKPVGAYRVLMEPRVTVAEEIEKVKAVPVWQRKTILTAGVVLVLVVIAALIWNFYFRPPPIEPASVEKMALPLPDKPSIAVLPFANIGGDPDQEYFSDGLTEEIITTLSKVSELFVIASNSTFTYKGKPVKIKQVAEELGVRYVLEGSVRKGEDRVRVTAQLIDALKGHHLWAEGYDRELKDILAVQGEIAKKIITALEVELAEGEQARVFARGTDSVEAWALGVKAWKLQVKYSKENNAKARELLEPALKLDPEYPFLWMALAHTHFLDGRFGWTKSRAESYKRAFEVTKKALTLDPEDPFAHSLLGTIYLLQRQHDKAIAEGQKAIALDPNYADGYAILSQTMRLSGRLEEALTLIKKAMRLCPMPRVFYPMTLGWAYFGLERYEEAIPVFKQLLERCRKGECTPWIGHIGLAASYTGLGREEEARAEAEEALKLTPKYSLEGVRKRSAHRDPAQRERYLNALRKAGIPEKPPLPLPDKPSIAVLPFVNMSGDPKQEYFSDGISEEIITALSKVPDLFVISRNSSFTYKGKSVLIPKVGRELGVRYVLEGSVRKAGNEIRITAKLVDAKTGNHLWAERYDRDLKDIFALYDEITMKILTSLQVKLTMGEHARRVEIGTNNLEAYGKVLQARAIMFRGNKEDNLLAQELLKEAIALDPNYPAPYIVLGWAHLADVWYRWSKSPQQSLARVVQLAQELLAMDDSRWGPHAQLGFVYIFRRQHENAIAKLEQAVAVAPNSDRAHAFLGRALHYAGRSDEAIPLIKKALRRNPKPESWMLNYLGDVYNATGQYEEAIAACKEAIKITPRREPAHITLTSAYSLSGRVEEASTQAEEVIRINPKYCVRRGRGFYKNLADAELFNSALRKAGLPDCPPR